MCYSPREMLSEHIHERVDGWAVIGGSRVRSGLTLIEVTVVIVMVMVLISMSMYAVNGYRDWESATEASQQLRKVYNAQRTYLAEHPTVAVSTLTAADIIPYLSDNASALPTVKDKNGNELTIKVNVSPPVLVDGGGTYDPSGDTDDGLWDVGR